MSLEKRISQLRRQLRQQDAPPNEESAKAWIIQPILHQLGWPSDDPAHVLYEHSVGGGRVDIALRTGGRPVAFLEAKAPGQDLRRHVTQVLQYAFHGGVDICVLATGIEWWFYLPREKGPPEHRRFAVLRIDRGSPRECAEVLRRYIGRDALGDRRAERNAKEALRKLQRAQRLKEEIPKVWKEMQSGDRALLELIARRVKESAGLSATPAEVARVLEMESGGDEHQHYQRRRIHSSPICGPSRRPGRIGATGPGRMATRQTWPRRSANCATFRQGSACGSGNSRSWERHSPVLQRNPVPRRNPHPNLRRPSHRRAVDPPLAQPLSDSGTSNVAAASCSRDSATPPPT